MAPSLRSLTELPEITLPPETAFRPGHVLAAAAHEFGPIFRTVDYLGNRHVYVVGPEANEMVMVTECAKLSSFEGWSRSDSVVETLGAGLIFMDGPDHDRLRAAAAPIFSPSGIARLVPGMNEIVAAQLCQWQCGRVIDLYERTYLMTFEIAARLLIGIESRNDIERLAALFHELVSRPAKMTEGTAGPTLASLRRREIRQQLADILRPVLAQGRDALRHTLLSRMAEAEESSGKRMSDDDLVAHANSFLLAGHITTSAVSAFLLRRLADDEVLLESIAAENRALGVEGQRVPDTALARMARLTCAIYETIRMFPPVPALPRGVREDIVFSGYLIPRGTLLMCSIAGAHMSESVFANPQEFCPARFSSDAQVSPSARYALAGFAAGPRRCLGMTMAIAEMKIIVSQVLSQFRFETLADNPVVPFYEPVLQPYGGLKVRLKAA
jgi:cytochrome P450